MNMRAFSDWIRQLELIDLPLGGALYMWTNCQEEPVMSRLDRFLIFVSWAELFPDCLQRLVSRPTSDHYLISLVIGLEDWGPPPFRLEIMWLIEKSFLAGVLVWWNQISYDVW